MPNRVLLVEDNFLVALDVKAALVELGFEVLGPASDSAGAIALVDRSAPFAFAVLDVTLQDGTCAPVIAKLQSLVLPFLLLTGYAEPDLDNLGPSTAIVTKPFARAALVAAIRQTLPSWEGPSR